MLPLAPEETLEALRLLAADEDEEIRTAVTSSVRAFDLTRLKPIVENPETPGSVLGFLASWKSLPRDIYQPLVFHRNVPDESLAALATNSDSSEVIEIVSLKQQALIQHPAIIDAILKNPRRTPESERRALEVRKEFFEKDFGAQIIEGEQRAQAAEAASSRPETVTMLDDLAQFIEQDLVDTGEALYEQFIEEYGTIADLDEPMHAPAFDIEALFEGEEFLEYREDDEFTERISVLARISSMSVKDRIRFALKGTREVRMILIRDPNRPVSAAVIGNPRITDQEIETISALKSVNEEVLRLIGMNRNWTRSYAVIHNLVRNPKTPVALSLNFLNRIQSKDLRGLSLNKNVPEIIRSMANRMHMKRQHG